MPNWAVSEYRNHLNRGHLLKVVRQSLAEAGLDITYGRLSQCVNRPRREKKRFGLDPKGAGKIRTDPRASAASITVGANELSRIEVLEERSPVRSTMVHPLVDFRERTAKTKTLDFEPGPPDESKLI